MLPREHGPFVLTGQVEMHREDGGDRRPAPDRPLKVPGRGRHDDDAPRGGEQANNASTCLALSP